MNKKPPDLPNIEDATLRACLAPLMEAMHAGSEPAAPPVRRVTPAGVTPTGVMIERSAEPLAGVVGCNDNPAPATETAGGHEHSAAPKTLAEWRSLADDDFGAFRMIELFLVMTDAELATAAVEFPKQIGGTLARIGRIRQRLLAQYDTVTTVTALLERALARAVSPGPVPPASRAGE
jgi:hypothetical protein